MELQRHSTSISIVEGSTLLSKSRLQCDFNHAGYNPIVVRVLNYIDSLSPDKISTQRTCTSRDRALLGHNNIGTAPAVKKWREILKLTTLAKEEFSIDTLGEVPPEKMTLPSDK